MSTLWLGGLGLLLSATGQFLLNRYLPAIGRSVDLFTVYVVYYAITRRRTVGMLVGASSGLLEDLLTNVFLGMDAFKKTLIGYVTGTVGSIFVLNQPLTRFGILFLATVVEALTEAGLYLVLGQQAVLPSMGDMARKGLGNGIVGVLVYSMVGKLES